MAGGTPRREAGPRPRGGEGGALRVSKFQPTGCVSKRHLKETSGTEHNTPNVVLTVAEETGDLTCPVPGSPLLTRTEILEMTRPAQGGGFSKVHSPHGI